MNLQDIKDVLTFNAFLPEPDDPSATWRKRFSGRKSLLLNLGRNQVSWAALGKGCKVLDTAKSEGDLKEIFTHTAEEWKKLTDGGWLGISLNARYVISLEVNLSRRKGGDDVLKTNPRAALGSKYEKGKRYAVTHNPESNTSLLLSAEEEFIKKVETLCRESGLSPARVCCGTYMLLRHLLTEVGKRDPKGQPRDPQAGLIYIVCNAGSVCILSQRGDQWLELRSRTDVYTDSPGPVLELLNPFRQQLAPPLAVAMIMDVANEEFSAAVKSFFEAIPVEDYTGENQLWLLLSEG